MAHRNNTTVKKYCIYFSVFPRKRSKAILMLYYYLMSWHFKFQHKARLDPRDFRPLILMSFECHKVSKNYRITFCVQCIDIHPAAAAIGWFYVQHIDRWVMEMYLTALTMLLLIHSNTWKGISSDAAAGGYSTWDILILRVSDIFWNCSYIMVLSRVGAIAKLHVSTPKSFSFVLKSTMTTKKWRLKVNNHPLIGFLVL